MYRNGCVTCLEGACDSETTAVLKPDGAAPADSSENLKRQIRTVVPKSCFPWLRYERHCSNAGAAYPRAKTVESRHCAMRMPEVAEANSCSLLPVINLLIANTRDAIEAYCIISCKCLSCFLHCLHGLADIFSPFPHATPFRVYCPCFFAVSVCRSFHKQHRHHEIIFCSA